MAMALALAIAAAIMLTISTGIVTSRDLAPQPQSSRAQ